MQYMQEQRVGADVKGRQKARVWEGLEQTQQKKEAQSAAPSNSDSVL